MAKFSIFFKDKPIQSTIFESGIVHIGRDETSDLIIDSLAIAPAHAAVRVGDSACIIKQLNSDFPLIINGKQLKEASLKNGDTITLGKHRIIYNSSESFAPAPSAQGPVNEALDQELSNAPSAPEANLQVMSGEHIGRLIPLKKNMTRLGRTGAGIIIVTRRKDGYHASMLEVDEQIKINNISLAEETVLLKNGDVLLIENVTMQFFMG